MEQRRTEPTRYLCAAVQIDENFCDQLIKEFFEEDYIVIGLSHGIDLPTVLKSCLLAKKRRQDRDSRLWILFFLLVATFLYGFFQFISPLHCFITISILYMIAWRIVFLHERTSLYDIVGKHLLKGNFNPDFLNSQINSGIEKALEAIANTQDANVIIYGGFSPFVGSGIYINGWSFAIDISKGKEEMGSVMKPLPFQVSELYDYISEKINELELSGLSIEDKLYVSGQEIRDRKEFLPDPFMRPITRVDNAFVKSLIDKNNHIIRHYRCIQVKHWKGELVFSIFLRFTKIQHSLFVDANYYLLTPLSQYYRQFDTIKSKPSSEDIRKIALKTALTTIYFGIASLISPFQEWSNSQANESQRKEKQKEIKSNPAFNYGATTSLRERISFNNQYHRYFQKLDQEMYMRVIERRIIDGLLKFLDSKKIDTSDFKETKSALLNHGLIVSGGSINATNLSVGEKAKAVFNESFQSEEKMLRRQSQ